ncbi:phosphoribosylglycinamide formyltransferase [Enterococcus hermanniensis]|uniref:Phosphoribosylglycinamide formyltransferase n=1 Tax=Enterococcus hermanniensis TaxID=249189 RepID=A0A1L8TL53_9ENTE|nr:phosphoribosylglycinamide formyltransferase [Enterococcus hermanniensis]
MLASGNGSNFEAIAQAVETGHIEAELALLFSDHQDAYVLERGKNFSIPTETFGLKNFPNKKAYEEALLKLLKTYEIDLVVLAGYMRIVGDGLLEAFPKKIINVHPSLLPAFPGLHGINDAYQAGVKETGVTIHYIDHGVDTGPIIAQEKVTLDPRESLETLELKIHQAEHELYPKVLAKVIKDLKKATSKKD